MNNHVHTQNIDHSPASVKPLVIWISMVALSCMCTVLIAQPSIY